MPDRKNPFLEAGFGEYRGIHRMPFALKDRAVTHETNRQRVVTSILLELHIMSVLGIIKKNEPLALGGAVVQSFQGAEERATEAAHCVPRQLLIGTKAPQELLQKIFPERAWALSVLFAETDILPANFNKCDSRVERLGLNKAFRNACQFIVEAGHYNGKLESSEIFIRAQTAYGIYKSGATFAFLESIQKLKDKLKPKIIFPKDQIKWTEQLQITEQYAETLRHSPGKQEGISVWKIEGLVKIYKMI